MTKEMYREMRKLTQQHFHSIWKIAKTGDLDILSEDDRRVAKIMLEHKNEYFNQFEMADLTYDHEFDPDSEENPFLHITVHLIVENQLKNRDPIEAYQFYNSMRKKKVSRHEAVHLIGAILAPLIVSLLQQKREFDLDFYVTLLKKYKNKKPDKIWDALDEDLAFLFQK